MFAQRQREKTSQPMAALLKQQEEDSLPSGTFSLGLVVAEGQSFPFSQPRGLFFCTRGGRQGGWLQGPPQI